MRTHFMILFAVGLALAACEDSRPGGSDAGAEMPEGVLHQRAVQLGEAVDVPIVIGETDAVALQFDLTFDPAVLELHESFSAQVEAAPNKELTVRHLKAGVARVVVFGFDLEPLPAGRLGTVRLRALRDTPLVDISAQGCVVADALGRMRANRIVDGAVLVSGEEVTDETP